MKQTSLIQSWTRATNSSACNKASLQFSLNNPSGPLGRDAEDNLLSEVLDQYDQSSSTDCHHNKITTFDALRQRPPVRYQATANDSEQLDGFDSEAGLSWVYPTNAILRDYQFNITEQCLYKNTLVCLPTGLGKTFIAAVVLYNFCRWYPNGKSVFMAPTRPLVSQQLNACRQLTDLSAQSVTELTGSIPQLKRKQLWINMKAFFLTPQVLVNDLQANVCPASSLRLLVFDEAHKATGNHAYCQVLRLLTNSPYCHRQFRIVALSATPAADIQGVQTLIANLLISHLELRAETSADVKRFTQQRQLETVVVSLGPELSDFQNQLSDCLRIPLARLRLQGALRQGMADMRPDQIAKYSIIKAREAWSSSPAVSNLSKTDIGSVQCDFGAVICLLHAMELLVQHGLRPLYQYLTGVLYGQRASPAVSSALKRIPGIDLVLSNLGNRFLSTDEGAVNLMCSQAPFLGGHPKFEKLKQLLCEHFSSSKNSETRAIVFSQFRDSVEEIMHMLKQLRPLIKPASFTGQTSALHRSPQLIEQAKSDTSPSAASTKISQRDQLRVLHAFRSGVFNTLVSTCVGEEGLDIGQVDLIICFDAFKSPIRLMQRLGRTGRQRLGRIVMLLTEGREEKNHAISLARTSSVHKALLEAGAYKKLAFYPHNPRMVPLNIHPKVEFRNFQPASELESTSQQSTKLSRKRKPVHSIKNRVQELHTDDARSLSDAIGLNQLPLTLLPIGSDRISCLNKSVGSEFPQPRLPCLTDLYPLNTANHLAATRECLQAYFAPGLRNGSSSSTRHLVSLLRLIELHRLGVTQLSFHALGLRSVDVDTTMTHLVGTGADGCLEDDAQPKAPSVYLADSPEKVSSVPEVQSRFLDETVDLVACPLKVPPLIRGIVSGEYFFGANVSKVCLEAKNCLRYLNSCPAELSNPITECGLSAAWIEAQTSMKSAVNELKPKPTPQISVFDGLERWVDASLLEAIGPDFAEVSHQTSPTPALNTEFPLVDSKMVCDKVDTISLMTPSNTKRGLDAAFCMNSPYSSVRRCIARSTPRSKSPCRPLSTVTQSTTQLGINEALVLLDQSSIQLDTSAVLDASQSVHRTSPLHKHSALFSGHIYPSPSKNSSLFQFDTKLSLGEDFGAEFLQPTQINTDQQPHQRTSSPCSSQTETDIFTFSPQISWSPVLVKDEDTSCGFAARHESPNLPKRSEHCSTSPCGRSSVEFNEVDKESSISPIIPLKHRATKYERANLLLQTQVGTADRFPIRPSKFRHPTANSFLLTQAEDSSVKKAGEDPVDASISDTYDESFIDDQIEESIEGNKSRLGASSMMSVYLQTIRSPPLRGTAKSSSLSHLLGSRQIHRTDTSMKFNPNQKTTEPFIFSQVPYQDDDYVLDSFCVNSNESNQDSDSDLDNEFRPAKRLRR